MKQRVKPKYEIGHIFLVCSFAFYAVCQLVTAAKSQCQGGKCCHAKTMTSKEAVLDVEEDARQVPLRRSAAGGGAGRGRDHGGGAGCGGSGGNVEGG
jgi:hypothetical protein